MRLGLYWSYATRSLLRGGQRSVLAIFCVAVGVMAIVALQLVGISVNQALVGNIVETNGSDLRVNGGVSPVRTRGVSFFDDLKQHVLQTMLRRTIRVGLLQPPPVMNKPLPLSRYHTISLW